MGRHENRGNLAHLARGHVAEDVAVPMHDDVVEEAASTSPGGTPARSGVAKGFTGTIEQRRSARRAAASQRLSDATEFSCLRGRGGLPAKSLPTLGLAMEALWSPAMALIEPLVFFGSALTTAAGAEQSGKSSPTTCRRSRRSPSSAITLRCRREPIRPACWCGWASPLQPPSILKSCCSTRGSAPVSRFATRAANRVKALIERSSIMVLASHSDELIRQMCKRAILLDHGRVVADGPTEDVLEIYARMNKGELPSNAALAPPADGA